MSDSESLDPSEGPVSPGLILARVLASRARLRCCVPVFRAIPISVLRDFP